MRKRRNGFTKFMSRLDGKPELFSEVDTSHFTIPEGLIVPQVRKLINDLENSGDTLYLPSAFSWSSSPQGFDYWYDIEEGLTEIDDEGMRYLYWLLEQET